MAASGTWGILRNALQEFPAVKWAGMDADVCIRTANTPAPDSDAFGVAARGAETKNGMAASRMGYSRSETPVVTPVTCQQQGDIGHWKRQLRVRIESTIKVARGARSFLTELRVRTLIAALSATGSAWWSPRLLEVTPRQSLGGTHLPSRPLGRSLLVTGGLGGLGVLFAHWAAQQASHAARWLRK